MSNVSEWAFNSFLIDCFKDPKVIEQGNVSDPQYLQLKEFLFKEDSLEILDFGAGGNRLKRALEKENIPRHYIDVYEPYQKDLNNLKQIELIRNIYSKLNEIEKEYDLILLTNVLHEIPVAKWVYTLNKIKSYLKKDGCLVILEDLELRVGEKPNDNNGYLILNKEELSVLLNYKGDAISILSLNDIYENRLECNVFSAELITKVNITSLRKALDKLQNRSYKNGRT